MNTLEVSAYANAPQALNTSTTSFTFLGGCALFWSSEANRQLKRHTPGTFSNLYIRISTNTITATSTYRFRKNTANGNQVVSVTTGATGEFQDISNTDAIVATDLVAISVVTGGTGTNITATAAGCQFGATTDTAQCMAFSGASNPTITSTLRFMPLMGGTDGGIVTSETSAQYKSKTIGTLQALSVLILSNSATNAVTAVSRINTANGNQTLSVGAGISGQFQDLVNTDSLSSGTLVNAGISVAAGGSGACQFGASYCELVTTNSSFVAGASGFSGLSQGISVTAYYPWTGVCLAPGYSTESPAQIKAQSPYIIANLATFMRLNSVSATSTFRLRKNAGNANQTVSITASTTGYFEDAVNTDHVLSTDEINYQLVTGGSGTSVSLAIFSTLVSIAGRLFSVSLLNGLGTGGPFLSNPLG